MGYITHGRFYIFICHMQKKKMQPLNKLVLCYFSIANNGAQLKIKEKKINTVPLCFHDINLVNIFSNKHNNS